MARPRSDVGRLQFREVSFETGEDNIPLSMTIHFREARETQVKSTRLGLMDDVDLCPIITSYLFIKKSKTLRQGLPQDHTFFVAYIEDPEKVMSIAPSTLSAWIRTFMAKAGIDTNEYKAHSIRPASSIKAVEKGTSIENVKEHAGWSLASKTFERYYYKIDHTASCQYKHCQFNFFYGEQYHIKSRSRVNKNCYTEVDETKTENVVHTRPYFWSNWFS